MNEQILSAVLAFTAYAILDVSKAVQKYALAMWSRKRLPAALLWSGATISTTGSILLTLYAVTVGSVVLVGSMAGTGLVVLILVSRILLRERTTKVQMTAVAVILIAPFLITRARPEVVPPDIDILALFVYVGAVAAGLGLAGSLVRLNMVRGLLIGSLAGALGGFVILFQKVSTSELGRNVALLGAGSADGSVTERGAESLDIGVIFSIFSNPYALGWLLLSVASALVVQFSYRHAESFRIVPVFDATNILISVIGGLLVFHLRIFPLQWVGIGFIMAAVTVLALNPHRTTLSS